MARLLDRSAARRRSSRITKVQLARIARAFQHIELRSAIKDFFDFLQMLAVLSVIAAVSDVVWPGSARAVQISLSVAAALFIAIPISRVQLDMIAPRRLQRRRRWAAMVAINGFVLAIVTATVTDKIVSTLQATVVVDQTAAKRLREKWELQDQRSREISAECEAQRRAHWYHWLANCPPPPRPRR